MSAVLFAVDMAFGVPAGTEPDEGDWVDVTADLDIDEDSDVVDARSGRAVGSDGITPGSCTFPLVSREGKYDPRNPDSPYAGDLVVGVPTRLRIGVEGDGLFDEDLFDDDLFDVGGVEYFTRWTGATRAPWPRDMTTVADPIVPVDAHDTLGIGAQLPMPLSAAELAVASLEHPPDAWWRSGVDGWICRRTGRSARSTSAMIEGEPVIDGGDQTWVSAELGEGRGEAEAGPFIAVGDDPFLVSMWVRLTRPTEPGIVTLLQQVDVTNRAQIRVAFSTEFNTAIVQVGRPGTARTWNSPAGQRVDIFDGRNHHLLVEAGFDVGGDGESVRLLVDGRQVGMSLVSNYTPPSSTTYRLHLAGGVQSPSFPTVINATGAVDHVLTWDAHPWTDLEELAAQLTAAGRLAWAGDSMNWRVARLATAAGLGDLLGPLDGSGITTQQGYRQSGFLDQLQAVENTEQGRVWCDAGGRIRFSSRAWAWRDERSTTVQATFSDVPELLDDVDDPAFELEADETFLSEDPLGVVARAEVTSTNGRMQVAENPSVAALWGPTEAVSLSGLLHPSDRQSLSIAEWKILSGADAPLRAELTYDLGTDPQALGPFTAAVEEGWLVRVVKASAPDCSGTPIGELLDITAHVIGIRARCRFRSVLITLTLDSTRVGYQFFTWGTSTWGGADGWAF